MKRNPRKRGRNDRKSEEDRQQYARSLVHQCRKDLNKQAKLCRNFECQKVSRKLKQEKKASQEELLREWRQLKLDAVVELCFRRLGMLDVVQFADENSDLKHNNKRPRKSRDAPVSSAKVEHNSDESVNDSSKVNDDDDREEDGTNDSPNNPSIALMERLLSQKRMREALESWSSKMREYRQWCTRQQQRWVRPEEQEDETNPAGGDDSNVDASRSLFLTLDDDPKKKKKKKNRPGQQARRARAAAAAAAAEGAPAPSFKSTPSTKATSSSEVLHPSWEARKAQQVSIAPFEGKKISFSSTTGSSSGKTEPEGENMHPSWQASKAQKTSIVAFKGKKITFD